MMEEDLKPEEHAGGDLSTQVTITQEGRTFVTRAWVTLKRGEVGKVVRKIKGHGLSIEASIGVTMAKLIDRIGEHKNMVDALENVYEKLVEDGQARPISKTQKGE